MQRRSQRHRASTLPYAYRDDGLEFELSGFSVDGEKPRDLELEPGQTHVQLPPDEDRDEWERVELYGSIRLPEETIEAVFPDDERSSSPAKLYVAIRCHETIYRDRVLVAEAPVSAKTYDDVAIRLDRSEFRGEVVLRPYLVRSEANEVDGPYASAPNLRVASGRIYTAIVDDDGAEGEAQIDGEEISFSQTPHLPDGDELYYLDLRNEARPKLWINADYPRITDVLQSEGSVGAEPRMRDVILDQIAYAVWSQLLVRAGCAVDEDGETEYQWQQTVIESFAREIYDTDSVEEAALSLRRDVRDPSALPETMSSLDVELQKYIEPREQLINLMEEGLQI